MGLGFGNDFIQACHVSRSAGRGGGDQRLHCCFDLSAQHLLHLVGHHDGGVAWRVVLRRLLHHLRHGLDLQSHADGLQQGLEPLGTQHRCNLTACQLGQGIELANRGGHGGVVGGGEEVSKRLVVVALVDLRLLVLQSLAAHRLCVVRRLAGERQLRLLVTVVAWHRHVHRDVHAQL